MSSLYPFLQLKLVAFPREYQFTCSGGEERNYRTVSSLDMDMKAQVKFKLVIAEIIWLFFEKKMLAISSPQPAP